MLINTIILFLRDLLPIFIAIVYLLSLFRFCRTLVFKALALGLLLGFCQFLFAEHISEWLDGRGMEISKVLSLVIVYSAFLVVTLNTERSSLQVRNWAMILGTACLAGVYFSGFLIFIESYLHQANNMDVVAMGSAVGFGICLSFATLFRFVIEAMLRHNMTAFALVLWCLFIAGQLSQSYSHLAQIDVIDWAGQQLVFTGLISESSEYGHVITALLGVELSPTHDQLGLYLVAAALPLIWILFSRRLGVLREVNNG